MSYRTGVALVTVILIYGIYAITEAVKYRVPPVHVVNCDVASFEHGAILSIPKESLDVAVEKIVGAEIIKRATSTPIKEKHHVEKRPADRTHEGR